jgi:hypothetical protein
MANDPTLTNPFDPFGTWRTTRDAYVETWSKTMLDLVKSEAYSDTTSRFLDSYLSMSAPIRKLLESTMTQVLGQLNMPNRGDVISLAERMTNIEMRLDDLDAKLDAFLRQLALATSAAPAHPPTPARASAPAARAVTAERSATARPAAHATTRTTATRTTPSRTTTRTTPSRTTTRTTPSRTTTRTTK